MPAVTLEKRPSETISGETSKWNAVANPITYRWQRKDFVFTDIDDLTPGDPIKLVITGSAIAATINAAMAAGTPTMSNGSPVMWVTFYNALYADGYYEFLGAVDGGGNTYIDIEYIGTLDVPSQGVNTGGFINSTGLVNFGIEATIHGAAESLTPTSLQYLTPTSFIQSAEPSGKIVFNASPILRSYLLADNDLDLVAATWAGTPFAQDRFKEFYIKYRMVYDGSAEAYTDDTANRFYATLSGLNIPSTYGSNLAEYVTFADGTPKAKWLTKMVKPVMWRGWPFSVAVIVGAIAADFKFTVTKDAANAESTVPDGLDNTVQQLSMKGLSNIDANTKQLEVKGFTGATLLTETLEIEMRQACQNPVMLLGRNAKGGPLYWLFGYRQVISYTDKDGTKVKELTLVTDDLTLEQWEALQDFVRLGVTYDNFISEFTSATIKTQSQVGNQLYILDEAGNKIGVTVVPRDSSTNNKNVTNAFEITVLYPEEFLT